MENIKVVAFDCDGVMFDTNEANKAYYNRILKYFGYPPLTQEQFAYTHMHTVDVSLDFLFQDQKIRKQADAVRKKLNYFSLIKYMEIEPGLKALIKKLRPVYKTAVATNRSDTMDKVLEEHSLEGCFDLVVSAKDVDRPKPYPDPLLKVATFFNVSPEKVLYIGDSEVDAQASEAAGMRFVAYDNPSLSADFHIRQLRELEGILNLNK